MTQTFAVVSGILAAAAATAATAQPPTPLSVSMNIERQPLDRALSLWSEQTGYQLLIPSEPAVSSALSPAVKGMHTAEGALRLLLASSHLDFKFVNARTVAIRSEEAFARNSSRRSAFAAEESSGGATNDEGLEEVLVTAQKRSERLRDVPVPVTAIGGSELLSRNQLRLQDYYTRIPGFTAMPTVLSNTVLSIRGLTTGFGTNPTVGITVDDVSYGSSTYFGGGAVVPDIDPSDLARIEVLRGPQGTLYGASSLGGLLKFVTVEPSVDKFSGRVQAGLNSVKDSDELGYNVRAGANIPLGETWALRVSGFNRRDAGYIDDVTRGLEDVNETDVTGGRVSTLWSPSDTFSLRLGATYQRTKADGSSGADFALGDLQQSRLAGTGWADRKVQAYDVTAKLALGNVEITSLSGYNINSYFDSFDGGYLYGTFTRNLFGVSAAELLSNNKNTKFTQELRLSMPLGSHVDWLVGAYYTDEDSRFRQTVWAVDPATAARAAIFRASDSPNTYEEYAAFTDFTFHVSDRFDIQFGGRQSHIDQTFTQTTTGPGAAALDTVVEAGTNASAFTYLVTPRFKLSPDLMMYARLASGYRAGGINSTAGPGTPPDYDPDKTKNYEVGVKGAVFDGLFEFDASLYRIDWDRIQVNVLNPTTARSYTTNGQGARSQGVELSLEARPLRGLSIATWAAFNDAELTDPFPATSTVRGNSGDRLPGSTRWSGNFSVDQSFPMSSSLVGVVGASASYVGERTSVFRGPGQSAPGAALPRQILPSYVQTDIRAGLRHESWAADIFVTNLTDQRGVLYGGLGAFPPFAFTYIQPRTAGVTVSKSF